MNDSQRLPGIAWNLTHPADLQMLADIANEFGGTAWGPVQLTGYDIAQVINTVIARAQRAEWS